MNPHDGLEEQPVRHGSSLVIHSAHGHDRGERGSYLRLAVFGYEREHDCDIAGLKGLSGGADHWSVK
jgi:hypothetical protein